MAMAAERSADIKANSNSNANANNHNYDSNKNNPFVGGHLDRSQGDDAEQHGAVLV